MTQQTNQQASQNTGNDSTQSSASAAAEPNLDTLVKQFETFTASPAKQIADLASTVRPLAEYVEGERQAKAVEAEKAAVDWAVEHAKGKIEGGDKIPKRFLRGALRDYAVDHPEFSEAYTNRESDKANYLKQLDVATESVGLEWKAVNDGGNSKNDIERAVLATRNQSTSAPPIVQFNASKASRMSDRDWENYKQEIIAGQMAAK